MTSNHTLYRFFLLRLLPALVLGLAALTSHAQTDPPARVGTLSHIEGSVAFAPAGEAEWTDAAPNRPITRGDRLWTDRGARAEVHLGSAVLHMTDQSFLDMVALDAQVLQASLQKGSLNMRVRELEAGENFEIDTPQLAFRAEQPGDYRLDVDPAQATTRVTVRSGSALVYGAGGQHMQLHPGQQLSFGGRDLAVTGAATVPAYDGFDRWAADRNRLEDQSLSARYVPREVVGYAELDMNGSWAEDPSYGPVWYPQIQVADWAPYRYGRWEWIAPWGWTWIDDARWGFAPFHYGRWALIGSHWAWVPGRLGGRPVYSPALVGFVGGSGGMFSIGSVPAIGWYPLAPGEAWRPGYGSTAYLRDVNRSIASGKVGSGTHAYQRRPEAVTTVRIEDFYQGRSVRRHWSKLSPADLARAQAISAPVLPEPRRSGYASRAVPLRAQPPTHFSPPVLAARPVAPLQPAGGGQPRAGERIGPMAAPGNNAAWRAQLERQEQARREARSQQELSQRQRIQQERAEREQQAQQQRVQQERQVQQLRAQREQQLLQQREEQVARARQAHEQRQMQHEHALQQQRAMPQQQTAEPSLHRPQPAVQAPQKRAEHGPAARQSDASGSRGAQGKREERASGEEDGRGGSGRGQSGRLN